MESEEAPSNCTIAKKTRNLVAPTKSAEARPKGGGQAKTGKLVMLTGPAELPSHGVVPRGDNNLVVTFGPAESQGRPERANGGLRTLAIGKTGFFKQKTRFSVFSWGC